MIENIFTRSLEFKSVIPKFKSRVTQTTADIQGLMVAQIVKRQIYLVSLEENENEMADHKIMYLHWMFRQAGLWKQNRPRSDASECSIWSESTLSLIQQFLDKSPGPSSSKLNEVVSQCDVKISVLKYGKYNDIFCCKYVSSFCIAKATHIFAAKISMCFYRTCL